MGTGRDNFNSILSKGSIFHQTSNEVSKKIEVWAKHLNYLFNFIEDSLKDYEESDQIIKRYDDITIYEEKIGSYQSRQLYLSVAGENVLIKPIGSAIIGAYGRVDIVGKSDSIKVILVDKNTSENNLFKSFKKPTTKQDEADLVWKLSTNPPDIKFYELTQDNLLGSIAYVVNG